MPRPAATLCVYAYVYALVRRTVRSLHPGQRLHLAGPAATPPASAARLRSRALRDAPTHAHLRRPVRRTSGDPTGQRRTPALSAPQGCTGLLPTLSCESECPPEKLRLGSAILPPRRPELHRRFGYRGD